MISRVALPNNGQTYRFGFNGKENDNGVKGLGNQQDYGKRIYDPRTGRFLSVDPITRQYPQLTPYQYASNRPIDGFDIDGLEWGTFTYKAWKDAKGTPHVTITREQYDDSWLERAAGTQLWLRPEGGDKAKYGSQGIPFTSFQALKDAAAKFGFGQADFDQNYEAYRKQAWQNFTVIAATDLALHGHQIVEGYVDSKIKSGVNPSEPTPAAATNKMAKEANSGIAPDPSSNDINNRQGSRNNSSSSENGQGARSTVNQTVNVSNHATSFEDVANYISQHGTLPSNFITKAQATRLGWSQRLGNLDIVAPGKSIGGDVFRNLEGRLPNAQGRIWYEADINYSRGYRGSDRIVYSNDGLIYKTTDHYQTFTQMTQ
jgi:RHS repeat-associated protein